MRGTPLSQGRGGREGRAFSWATSAWALPKFQPAGAQPLDRTVLPIPPPFAGQIADNVLDFEADAATAACARRQGAPNVAV